MANERSRRRTRRVLLAVFGLALGGLLAWAWWPQPVEVDAAHVERGPMQVTVNEEGVTRVVDRYVVSAPVAGRLRRIELRAGDPVQDGQVVARIEPAEPPLLDVRTRTEAQARVGAAEASVRQATAKVQAAREQLDRARLETTRQRALVQGGATAQRDLDDAITDERTRTADLASARSAVRVAQEDLARAQAALRRLSGEDDRAGPRVDVVAPVSGAVLRVARESEGPVQMGEALLEVGDPSALEAVVDVLSTDAVRIRPGAPVALVRWGGNGALSGRVRRVEPSGFTKVSALGVEEQRVNVIVEPATGDGWGPLGDGYRIEARIVTWRADDVLQVPAGATFRSGDGWAVYVIDEGRARQRAVRLGERNDDRAQVLGGLREGDPVVLHPSEAVREGARVRAQGRGGSR